MPYRKSYNNNRLKKTLVRRKKTTSKYPIKKRYINRYQGQRPFTLPMPFPARILTKLTFDSTHILTATYPDVSSATMRLGSLYDPEFATGGGQAGWFDVIKSYYRANIVRGCKYELQFLNDSTEAVTVDYILTSYSDGPIADTLDWSSLRAYQSGSKLLGHSTGSNNRVIYRRYADLYKLNGLSRTESKLCQSNPLVSTQVANPNIASYLQIKAACSDGSGTFKVLCLLKMTFYCEFFDIKIAMGQDA